MQMCTGLVLSQDVFGEIWLVFLQWNFHKLQTGIKSTGVLYDCYKLVI